MGNSALGRGTAVEENKVKASSGDATPDFLDGKVGTTTQVVSDLLEIDVNSATDTVITAADEVLFGDVTDSNNVKKDTVQGILDLAGGGLQTFVGRTTRDTTLASGNQAFTGVGFQPLAVIILGQSGISSETSWGFSDATTDRGIYDRHSITADVHDETNQIVHAQESASDSYTGTINSFDSDGFTIAWTRTGTPSGTLGVSYLCIA